MVNILFTCTTRRFSALLPGIGMHNHILSSCSVGKTKIKGKKKRRRPRFVVASLISLNVSFSSHKRKMLMSNMARACRVIPLNPWDEHLPHARAANEIFNDQVFHHQGGTVQAHWIYHIKSSLCKEAVPFWKSLTDGSIQPVWKHGSRGAALALGQLRIRWEAGK